MSLNNSLLTTSSNLYVDHSGSGTTAMHDLNNGTIRGERYFNNTRNSDSNKGLCGLQNMGNTCFMNSALQCLSNVPDLTEYFLNNDHNAEINVQNPLGTQGQLVRAYAELLQEMWSGQTSSTRPYKLKITIGRFAPRFNGFAQQDSQELTAFLLDGLHEDLNRIKKKPYVEEKEEEAASNVNQAQAALDAWEDYKKRNDSVIVDLMHGQLKSTLTCSACKKVSLKFDPFCFLSIPIPANEQEVRLAMGTTAEEQRQLSSNTSEEEPMEVVQQNQNGDLLKSVHCVENGGIPAPPPSSAEDNVERPLPLLMSSSSPQQSLVMAYSYELISWLLFLLNYINPLKIFPEMVKNMFSSAIPLTNCLNIFFSVDHLHGDDMYSCEQCKKLRNGLKHSSLTRLPRVLVIHLKRFRHEGTCNTKLRTRITFPLYNLDMAPFMEPEALRDARGNPVPTEYNLCGLISHRGQNMEYGHYVAYCRNVMDQNWYEFDDSQVTRVSPLEVLNQEAYVLFFERNDCGISAESETQSSSDDTELYEEAVEMATAEEQEKLQENVKESIPVPEAVEEEDAEMVIVVEEKDETAARTAEDGDEEAKVELTDESL